MQSVVKKKIQAIAFLAITISKLLSAVPWHHGLNLPATQGTSNAGNFQPGVFPFDYTADIRKRIVDSPFTHLRLSLNVETAHNTAALEHLESLAALTDYRGILCMWDTNLPGETGHGNGLPNDLDALANAWKVIHAKFAKYPNLRYEIFNEPFGYPYTASGAQHYLADMRYIIEKAGLPLERCVLNGLGYAQEVKLLVNAGWQGTVAYHVYPNWLPEGQQTADSFADLIVSELSGVPNQILITEYGTNLTTAPKTTGSTSLLTGLPEAIRILQKQGVHLNGSYHWHGWDNGDSYSLWAPNNEHGAHAIQSLQSRSIP